MCIPSAATALEKTEFAQESDSSTVKGALKLTLLFHKTAGVPFIKRLRMESKCVVVSGSLRPGCGCEEGRNGVGRGFLPDCALIAANRWRVISRAHPGAKGRVGIGASGCWDREALSQLFSVKIDADRLVEHLRPGQGIGKSACLMPGTAECFRWVQKGHNLGTMSDAHAQNGGASECECACEAARAIA